MPGSFTCLHVHAVFGTKHRTPFLADVDSARLHELTLVAKYVGPFGAQGPPTRALAPRRGL